MDVDWNSLLSWKAGIILVWFAAFFAGERLAPAARLPLGLARRGSGAEWRRLGRNLGLWLVNVVLSPLIVVPSAVLAADLAPDWRPAAWLLC